MWLRKKTNIVGYRRLWKVIVESTNLERCHFSIPLHYVEIDSKKFMRTKGFRLVSQNFDTNSLHYVDK